MSDVIITEEEITPQEIQTAVQIAKDLVPDLGLEPDLKPHEFIKKNWDSYKANYP